MDNPSFTLLAQPPAQGFSEKDIQYDADVAIVGAGPGGGAAAKLLSQAGLRVVVLEMGPRFSTFQRNYAHTARYHMQEGGAMVAQGQAMMPIAAGQGVGGSTLINSALSFRAPRKVLDHWANILHDENWGFDALKPIYDEISEFIGVSITPQKIAGKNNELIVRGIKKLGYDGGLAPRNTPKCVGCGICYYGCPSGGKGSSNLNFLAVAQQNNTIIQAETRVETLIIEQNKIVGIQGYSIDPDTKKRGGRVVVRAPRVILSAGAIGTPRLLWHSKVAHILGKHVGEGLQVHPGSGSRCGKVQHKEPITTHLI
jgi:choline dehydrogenase-like flavoprotein